MPPLSPTQSPAESASPTSESEQQQPCDDSVPDTASTEEPVSGPISVRKQAPSPIISNLAPLPPRLPAKPAMSLLSPSTWTFRYIHSTVALVAVLPLLLTLLTGFAYRFSRGVLHSEKANVKWLLDLHSMSTLSLHTVYPLLVALLTLIMAATGMPLGSLAKALQRLRAGRSGVWSAFVSLPNKYNLRTAHRMSTTLLMLPLSLTALTGAVWTVQQHYLGYSHDDSGWLMAIHQGSYLAPDSRGPVFYTALLLLLTLPALLSGVTLLPQWSEWRGAGGGARGGAAQSGRGVRYTMLSVKQAFEGDEDEHDSDAVGTVVMDEEQSGRSIVGRSDEMEEHDESSQRIVSTASNGR